MLMTSTDLVRDLMSKVPWRICLEYLLKLNGPIFSAMGLVVNGVLDAWEKCTHPHSSSTSHQLPIPRGQCIDPKMRFTMLLLCV